MDKRTIAIILLSAGICLLLWMRCEGPEPEKKFDRAKYDSLKRKFDSLGVANIELKKAVSIRDSLVPGLNHNNLRLDSLKPEIKIVYRDKYEKINYLGVNALAADFARIFAADHIN